MTSIKEQALGPANWKRYERHKGFLEIPRGSASLPALLDQRRVARDLKAAIAERKRGYQVPITYFEWQRGFEAPLASLHEVLTADGLEVDLVGVGHAEGEHHLRVAINPRDGVGV